MKEEIRASTCPSPHDRVPPLSPVRPPWWARGAFYLLSIIQLLRHNVYNEKHPRGWAKYLRSDHWKWLRSIAIKRSGRLCESCGSSSRIEVHHTRYGTLYDVRPDELIVLCQPCHALVHQSTNVDRRVNKRTKKIKAKHFGAKQQRNYERLMERGRL